MAREDNGTFLNSTILLFSLSLSLFFPSLKTKTCTMERQMYYQGEEVAFNIHYISTETGMNCVKIMERSNMIP